MKRLAFVAVMLWATLARAETLPPLAAYGKLPQIETVQISPDGSRIAFIVTDGDTRYVAVSDLGSEKVLLRVPTGRAKVMSVQWVGRDHVIVTSEQDATVWGLLGGERAYTTAFDVDLARRRGHALIDVDTMDHDRDGVNMNVIYGEPQVRTIDGKTWVYVKGIHFEDNRGMVSLFRYDPDRGVSALYHGGARNTEDWLVGEDGEPLAETLYDDQGQRWTLRDRVKGGLATAMTQSASIERPSIEGLGRDGRSIVLAIGAESATEGKRTAVVELKPGDTSPGKPLVDGEADGLVFDPVTERLIGSYRLDGDTLDYAFFDPKDQARWRGLRKAYASSTVKLESMSGDHQRWIVSVDSPTEGPAYALVDFATGKADWLGYNYEQPSKQLAPKTPIAFKAADGFELSGYLTVPKGREAKDLPLVVFPHGGPEARDEPGFDWWAQAMASRGYAVLQVNYRGSDGFGWKYLSAGFGQWGRKMQTDLSDGVRYLAAKGTIDPKRVCIVGASYGGYAALAGATLDPGVYRCAVSVAGISDLRRLARWEDQEHGATAQRYALRFLGVDKLGDPRLGEISPLNHVDKAAIPILLIHGRDDTVVDISQSQLMYDALKRAGKDAQLVALPHEDHWLLTGATRLQMLQATMDFLQKNNPPG